MLIGSQNARGVSLLEVLVALVVASLGLMAFASLQARSLRYTQVSQRRVQAHLLAEEFMERLRANALAAPDLGYYTFAQPFSTQVSQAVPAAAKPCEGAAVVCSIDEMAAFDLAEVRTRVRDLMAPDGALVSRLDVSDTEGHTLDLWLAWREPRPTDTDAALRPAGECPAELGVDDDMTVRCLRWRVRR